MCGLRTQALTWCKELEDFLRKLFIKKAPGMTGSVDQWKKVLQESVPHAFLFFRLRKCIQWISQVGRSCNSLRDLRYCTNLKVAQETKLKTIGCGTTRWQHRPWIFQEHQFQMESEITWLEIHLFQLQSWLYKTYIPSTALSTMVPTPIQCTRSSTALCATAARGPDPLATLLLVGSPYELGSIYIKTPSPCSFQMPFQQLWICTYDMLAFPVLNQVERLKGADDVFSFDSSHVAQLLHTGKKEKPSAKRITFRYS